MKISVSILVLILLSGCTTIQDFRALREAHRNFTYQEEPEGQDVHIQYKHHDKPFTGDCEDFSHTLQFAIGGDVWYVAPTKTEVAHAVLVKGDRVYDNKRKTPWRLSHFDSIYDRMIILKFNGKVVDNSDW